MVHLCAGRRRRCSCGSWARPLLCRCSCKRIDSRRRWCRCRTRACCRDGMLPGRHVAGARGDATARRRRLQLVRFLGLPSCIDMGQTVKSSNDEGTRNWPAASKVQHPIQLCCPPDAGAMGACTMAATLPQAACIMDAMASAWRVTQRCVTACKVAKIII